MIAFSTFPSQRGATNLSLLNIFLFYHFSALEALPPWLYCGVQEGSFVADQAERGRDQLSNFPFLPLPLLCRRWQLAGEEIATDL